MTATSPHERRSAPVAGVVLAAGTGRRMGRPKALIEVDGRPLLSHAVAAIVAGGCDPVGVVVGAAAEEVTAVAAGVAEVEGGLAIIDNPGWASGMASSVREALRWAAATTPSAGALLVLPVDTPGIGAPVIRRLLDRWEDDDGRALVATYDGRRRNPVLLPAAEWDAVAARVHGDTGAKGWLQDNPDHVVDVDCTDLGVPTDLDTPLDLIRWNDRSDGPAHAPTTGERHGA